jgi:hypothetical protein
VLRHLKKLPMLNPEARFLSNFVVNGVRADPGFQILWSSENKPAFPSVAGNCARYASTACAANADSSRPVTLGPVAGNPLRRARPWVLSG